MGPWGLRQDVLNKIDVFHRKHLRKIVGIRWPQRISNDELYKLCNTEPLSINITRLRWQLFGHILRLHPKTPAQIAMDYYVMKPSEPLEFDVEGFDAVNDFLHGTFYLTYVNFEKKGIFRRDIPEDTSSKKRLNNIKK